MSNAEIIASAIEGLNSAERDEFRSLWQMYLEAVNDGEPQLILPEKVGQKLGIAKLREIALNYSSNLGVHVRVVHDSVLKAYLIGDSEEFPFGNEGQKRIFDTNEHADLEDSLFLVPDATFSRDEEMEDPTAPTYGSFESLDDFGEDDLGWSQIEGFGNPFSYNESNSDGVLPLDRSHRIMAGFKREKPNAMEVASKPPKRKEPKLPKPSNSFILYRKFKQPMVLASHPDLHCSKVSKIIGDMWRVEDPTVKAEFQRQADEQKRLFMEKNPDWKCSPRKSSDIRRRKTASGTSINRSSPAFSLNQGGQLTNNVYTSFDAPDQSQNGQFSSEFSGPTTTPTQVSVGYSQVHAANSSSKFDTLDVAQESSEPLPDLFHGDLPWSMGIDMDEHDWVDHSWFRSLSSIDVNTPDQFLSRRNFFLEDVEAAQQDTTETTNPSV